MTAKNIFPHPNEEEQTNLSAPLEGEFFNPQDDTGTVTPASLGNNDVTDDSKLVGTDGNPDDKDSSLTVDTDEPAAGAGDDLSEEVDDRDADSSGSAVSGG